MEQSLTTPNLDSAGHSVRPLLAEVPDSASGRAIGSARPARGENSGADLCLKHQLDQWQQRVDSVPTCEFLTPPEPGPVPPPEWAPAVHQLVEWARTPAPAPDWWNAAAFCASIETEIGPVEDPTPETTPGEGETKHGAYLYLSLAGWGNFSVHGREPQKIGPGKAFFAIGAPVQSHSVPPESPGWVLARLGVYHPYLRARLAKQVAVTGPLVDVRPDEALAASVLRLVRGAIKKDFHDQFDAEIALFKFVLTFERWARQTANGAYEAQRLMEDVRSRIVARLPKAIGVHSLAAEFGMSRSHFSHFFRERTGLTPAHFATEVRVQRAARMLLDTRDPLKTIADACGFANANHLCKVFRRYRHLSPASFRQACR